MKNENEQKIKYEELLNKDYGIEYESQEEKEFVIKTMIQFSEIVFKMIKNENNILSIKHNDNTVTKQYKQAA